MASDNRIVIDEVAAQKDIQNLNQSVEHLTQALEYMEQILLQAAEFQGNTGAAIQEDCRQITRMIQVLVDNNTQTIQAIRSAVDRFQSVDEKLKQEIENIRT